MTTLSGNIQVEAFTPELLRGWTFVPLITVYRNPRDFPGKWVARLFDLNRPTPIMAIADSHGELLKALPPSGMVRMPRRPDDDPVIEEVWM